MDATAAPSRPFDLHWRLFGIDFRVQPSFWLVQLIFGYLYVSILRQADERIFAYLGIWLACAFVSIMVHELGHVIVGRVFGARSNIVLGGMGGMAIGNFPQLKAWQRILVYAAGPAFGLALFAFVEWGLFYGIRAYDFPLLSNRWYEVTAGQMGLFQEGERGGGGIPGMLVIMNLIWNIFNLIPIIPLDGGQIMRELFALAIPRYGSYLAYGFSFLLAGGCAVYSFMVWQGQNLPYIPRLHPGFAAFMFGWMAFQCFGAMQSLQTPEPPPRRHREYEEKDW